MKKITIYTFLALFLNSAFVGVSSATTELGTGTVYESCENNEKKMNIYRENSAYKKLDKVNKKGNTVPCRFGLVSNESPVKGFIKKLFKRQD
tara:strand:- start:638 stop:913 length:276 start_codon:yes stop_codon:yes gene_type:complete